MENIIKILYELKQKTERSFITNSIICKKSNLSSPIPDTNFDLEMIIELNKAIAVLQSYKDKEDKT